MELKAPALSHSEAECMWIAKLMRCLNRFNEAEMSLEGSLDVYWQDCLMGTVRSDSGRVSYYPLAIDSNVQQIMDAAKNVLIMELERKNGKHLISKPHDVIDNPSQFDERIVALAKLVH